MWRSIARASQSVDRDAPRPADVARRSPILDPRRPPGIPRTG